MSSKKYKRYFERRCAQNVLKIYTDLNFFFYLFSLYPYKSDINRNLVIRFQQFASKVKRCTKYFLKKVLQQTKPEQCRFIKCNGNSFELKFEQKNNQLRSMQKKTGKNFKIKILILGCVSITVTNSKFRTFFTIIIDRNYQF